MVDTVWMNFKGSVIRLKLVLRSRLNISPQIKWESCTLTFEKMFKNLGFSCCFWLFVLVFWQIIIAQSPNWCHNCLCGPHKSPVLKDEYCCVSTKSGCENIVSSQGENKLWCSNATILAKASRSCNKRCYKPTVTNFLVLFWNLTIVKKSLSLCLMYCPHFHESYT